MSSLKPYCQRLRLTREEEFVSKMEGEIITGTSNNGGEIVAEENVEDKETESDERQDADVLPRRSYVLMEGRRKT